MTHGKHFKAHKSILTKHCTKLKYLLENSKITQTILRNNEKISRVHLKSSLHAVAYFLVHVYIPPFNIDQDNIEDVAEISLELGCIALALECKNFIKTFVQELKDENIDFERRVIDYNDENVLKTTAENVVKYINICEKLHFVKLFDNLYKTIRNNFYKFSKNIEVLYKLNANTMRALIFDSELCIESEVNLFYTIFYWIKFNEPCAEILIEDFFKAVSFESIDISTLIEIENQLSGLFENKVLNDLLFNAIKYHSMKEVLKSDDKKKIHKYILENVSSTKIVKESSSSSDTHAYYEEVNTNLSINSENQITNEEKLKCFKAAIILITNSKTTTMLGIGINLFDSDYI